MQTFEWAIEDIGAAYPHLSLDHCAAMAVALMKPIARPCGFLVRIRGFDIADLEGTTEFGLSVTWTSHTENMAQRLKNTEQQKPIVERAAVALAALLFAHHVPDSFLTVAMEGERYDYRLPKLREGLEVSGTERFDELESRVKEKRAQLVANPRGWNGFVVVCCFAQASPLIQWNHYSQMENRNGSHEE
ncbi:MAG: hypothetical protein HYR84_07620 [Planctomycetes bacterium]|nr:hypothetical protein [Planctomycetota bacterium]